MLLRENDVFCFFCAPSKKDDFELEISQCVLSGIQNVTKNYNFLLKNLTRRQILKQDLYKVSDFEMKNLKRVRNWKSFALKNHVLIYVTPWKGRFLQFFCTLGKHNFKLGILRRVRVGKKLHNLSDFEMKHMNKTCQKLKRVCVQKIMLGNMLLFKNNFIAFSLFYPNAWFWIRKFTLLHIRTSIIHKVIIFVWKF